MKKSFIDMKTGRALEVKIEIGNLELYKVSSLSGHDRKTFKYGFMSRSVIKLQVVQ